MEEKFYAFLETPNRENFLAVRSELMDSADYDPYSQELEVADELIDKGEFQAAGEAIRNSMANLLLSPRAHLYLSIIAENLGQQEVVDLEDYMASACCEGLLATGDGTQENPYLIIRPSDEYDLLMYLEREAQSEDLVESDEHSYDVVTCQDGSSVWFDLTAIFERAPEPDWE